MQVAAPRARPDNGEVNVTETAPPATAPANDPERGDDERGLRFEDPYWDEVFCAWWDPTLRTCC